MPWLRPRYALVAGLIPSHCAASSWSLSAPCPRVWVLVAIRAAMNAAAPVGAVLRRENSASHFRRTTSADFHA